MQEVSMSRWQQVLIYGRLLRLDRPAAIFMLLWPTLTALWFAAGGIPSPKVLFVFGLGVVVMRTAGGLINDYTDRNLDAYVARTAQRPLAAGLIQPRQAMAWLVILMGLALLLAAQLNLPSIKLALIGGVLTCLYPWMKRITHWPQLFLGVVWSWSILLAYTAQNQAFTMTTWLLFGGNLLLTMAYDTMYALADREDDLKIGVKSLAIWLGRYDLIGIALMQALAWCTWLLVGWIETVTWPYFLSLGFAAVMMIWQHGLIRKREACACIRAFHSQQWLLLVLWLGACWSL
ncbi:MAG: 4-hydroxybenzoate octaprenyltransferase [Shewanellaceae bacterium]|nr:4-hydroxybenzoate octaprenyltransferase [Shewanellaceae bacterium]